MAKLVPGAMTVLTKQPSWMQLQFVAVDGKNWGHLLIYMNLEREDHLMQCWKDQDVQDKKKRTSDNLIFESGSEVLWFIAWDMGSLAKSKSLLLDIFWIERGHFVVHFGACRGNTPAQNKTKHWTVVSIGNLYALWFVWFGTSRSGRMAPVQVRDAKLRASFRWLYFPPPPSLAKIGFGTSDL